MEVKAWTDGIINKKLLTDIAVGVVKRDVSIVMIIFGLSK